MMVKIMYYRINYMKCVYLMFEIIVLVKKMVIGLVYSWERDLFLRLELCGRIEQKDNVII